MKRKYIIFFMQFFTSLCIVSVGFASWTFVSGDSITATGNIYAEDVKSNDLYVSLASDVDFRYCDSGFVTGSGTSASVSTDGYLVFTYNIKLHNLKTDLGNQNPIKVMFTLSHTSIPTTEDATEYFTLIQNYSSVEATLDEAAINFNSTTNSATKSNNTYVVTIDITSLVNGYTANADGSENTDTSIATLEVKYKFTAGSVATFKSSILPCLKNDSFSFSHKVDVNLD